MSARKRNNQRRVVLLLFAAALVVAVIGQSWASLPGESRIHESRPSILPQDGIVISPIKHPNSEPLHLQQGAIVTGSIRIPAAPAYPIDTLEHKVYIPAVGDFGPTTYYVSRIGTNAGGRTWVTAWNEMDQIDWEVIKPGDTILLDGGSAGMVYTTTLAVGNSGTAEKPIMIMMANKPGRMGQVIIFGGRSTPLPYCGETSYEFETAGVRGVGILIGEHSWVVIDGKKWGGISLYGHNRNGIRLYPASSHITVRNVEIYDNGTARYIHGRWVPDGKGVDLTGANISFERVIIHDNGQDALQSAGGLSDFTLRQSWLYNLRMSPTSDEPFNYCVHPDGIQVYDGGQQSGLVIEASVIGPGFMQGVILGQTLTAGGAQAVVNNVTLRDVLFTKALGNNIMGYHYSKPQGWIIDHVTAHCPNTDGHCLLLDGSGHTVNDSIFHSGNIYLPDSLSDFGGNCQWNTTGFPLGRTANPQFVNVLDSDNFSLDDYSLSPGSLCTGKGSRITSVEQLLAQPVSDETLP